MAGTTSERAPSARAADLVVRPVILETNEPMNRAMEALAGHVAKRYRVYGKPLGAG